MLKLISTKKTFFKKFGKFGFVCLFMFPCIQYIYRLNMQFKSLTTNDMSSGQDVHVFNIRGPGFDSRVWKVFFLCFLLFCCCVFIVFAPKKCNKINCHELDSIVIFLQLDFIWYLLDIAHLFSRDRTKLVIHVSLSPCLYTFDHISLFCYFSYTT